MERAISSCVQSSALPSPSSHAPAPRTPDEQPGLDSPTPSAANTSLKFYFSAQERQAFPLQGSALLLAIEGEEWREQ